MTSEEKDLEEWVKLNLGEWKVLEWLVLEPKGS